jgi:hypothetical protein
MAAAYADEEKAGSEEAREAAPGTQGSQLTSSASPGSEDRVELGDAPLGPAQDGSLADAFPPVPSDGDGADHQEKEEEERKEEEEEEGQAPRRSLRPRNAAGAVVHPPKTPADRVFRRGGGRN